MLTMPHLEEYLKKYGWNFERPEQDVILTSFYSEQLQQNFMITIRLASPWLRMDLPAYLPMPEDNTIRFNMMQEMFKMNYQYRQAYFALTDNEEITICLDLYIEHGLAYETFEAALDVLTYAAENSYVSLVADAKDE